MSGFASVLLAKTLRSSTLKLALLCIAIFGAVVIALLGYVYWSTATFVHSRADDAIATDLAALQRAYAAGRRDGLIAAITQRVGDQQYKGRIYLFTDPSFLPLAGNLAAGRRS